MPHAGRALALSELRERIGRLECRGRSRNALPFGVRAVDRHLPGGGLTLNALHEVMETAAASEHAAAATLFIAGILARNKGPVLWCVRRRDLFAPALAAVGLHPDRVIYAERSTRPAARRARVRPPRRPQGRLPWISCRHALRACPTSSARSATSRVSRAARKLWRRTSRPQPMGMSSLHSRP